MFWFGKTRKIRRIKTASWKKVEITMNWKDPKSGEEWTATVTTKIGILKQFLMRSNPHEIDKK